MRLIDEPMLYQCDAETTLKYAKSGTKLLWFWQKVKDMRLGDMDGVLVDTRVQVLQRGMFPCIPGWHLDFIKRDRQGLLDLEYPHNNKLEHYICSFGPARTLETTFKLDAHWLSKIESWATVDPVVRSMVTAGFVTEHEIPEGSIRKLNWDDLHRGRAATRSGERLFLRATFGAAWIKPKNEIRK